MKRRQLKLWASLAISVAACSMALSQGFYAESSSSDEPEQVTTIYYMPKMLKTVDGNGSSFTIFRFDKETMYTIKPEERTYTAVTFDEMKAMMTKARAGMDEFMAKQLESATPEEKERIKESMAMMSPQGASRQPVQQVVATGEHKTISGYACEKYIVKRDGKEVETIWATKNVGEFKSMKRDLQDISDRLASTLGIKNGVDGWYKEIDGFPIQTESDGSVETVTKLQRKSIPLSEFEVPAGYTKEEDEMMENIEE